MQHYFIGLWFFLKFILSVGSGRRHIEGIGRQASLMCDRVRMNNIENQYVTIFSSVQRARERRAAAKARPQEEHSEDEDVEPATKKNKEKDIYGQIVFKF